MKDNSPEQGAVDQGARVGATNLWLPADHADPEPAAAIGGPDTSHKRVCRIMHAHNLLLARMYAERPEHVPDGKVIVMRSNLGSPVGSNQWRLTGSLFEWVRVHLLERRRHP